MREYKAMRKDKFLSSWLRENVDNGGWKKVAGEDESESGKREVGRKEEKTVSKRRCVNPISRDFQGL